MKLKSALLMIFSRVMALLALQLPVIASTAEVGELLSSEHDLSQPLVITSSAKWKPYSYINKQGEPAGILVDYWKVVAEQSGFDVEFKLVSWNESLELVKHGQADVHAGLIQSPERDLFLDFGPEIMAIETHVFLDQHLLGTDFDKIFSGEVDIKVGVVLGGYEAYYAAQYLPKLNLVYFATNEDMLYAASSAKLEGFISDYQVANLFMFTENSQKKYVPVKFLYSEPLRFGVKEGNDVLWQKLANATDKVSDASKMQLFSRWIYMETVYPKYFIPIIISVALMVLCIYILMLRRAVIHKTIDLERANHLLEKLAQTDELTKISNRRHFQSKIAELQGTPVPFTLLVFDIDNFKLINDQFGHEVGDQAIVHVVRHVQRKLSNNDFIARLGGEEFAIILTLYTFEEVKLKAQYICQSVYENPMRVANDTITLSISLGGAYYDLVPDKVSLTVADSLMYQAKSAGKNRAVVVKVDQCAD